jgi:hypothetical protein
MDKYFEGGRSMDLHTKPRPLGVLNYPWSINNIKEGGCCGSVLFSILPGPHPYKISSMTFHM